MIRDDKMRMRTQSFKAVLLFLIVFGIACRVSVLWFSEEVTPTANIGIFDLDINETLQEIQTRGFKLHWHDIKLTTLLPTITPVQNMLTTTSATSRRKRKEKKLKRRFQNCPAIGESLSK